MCLAQTNTLGVSYWQPIHWPMLNCWTECHSYEQRCSGIGVRQNTPPSLKSCVVLGATHESSRHFVTAALCLCDFDSQIRALEPLILAVHSLLLHCTAGPLRPLMNVSCMCACMSVSSICPIKTDIMLYVVCLWLCVCVCIYACACFYSVQSRDACV